MSETTENESSGGIGRWILILLLLIAIAVGAAWYLKLGPFARDDGDGSFVLNFRGCDDNSPQRCGDFTLYAPGYAYSWELAKDDMAPVDGAEPDLAPKIREYITGAQGAIAAGLASQEGDSQFNLPLSSCRSQVLAGKLSDAQRQLGTDADLFRVTVGGYAQGEEAELPEGTEIQRMVVMAFYKNAPDDLNISQALQNGLKTDLPRALLEVLAPIAAQLDFTKYECWNDDFSVTPANEQRTACYPEPSATASLYCQTF